MIAKFKNKKFYIAFSVLFVFVIVAVVFDLAILWDGKKLTHVIALVTPGKPVAVLDCSTQKECKQTVIRHTIKNCDEWYGDGFLNALIPPCEKTTENIEKVTLLADPVNHVKSAFTDSNYFVEVRAPGLQKPWDLEFLPGGTALITQKDGELVQYNFQNGQLEILATLDVLSEKAIGLMGLAIDPDYESNNYIYLYYTTSYDAEENEAQGRSEHYVLSRISRFTLGGGELSDKKVLLDNIPGSIFHAGGRLEFGPDGKLYATTGDGNWSEKARDANILLGKILRINPDGTVPEDNPFENSYVYSLGHRNPQGMGWHPVTQEFFVSEHGPWRYDEINLVTKGANYGWPIKKCDDINNESGVGEIENTINALQDPSACFKDWTLAPGGMTFVDDPEHPWFGDLFVAGLRSKHLHRFEIENGEIVGDEIFFVNKEVNGMSRRLRDVEFYNGSLWVIGDFSGIARISPR